jgi:hypothetical protein
MSEKNSKTKKMKKNIFFGKTTYLLHVSSNLWSSTCKWQGGEGKYHIYWWKKQDHNNVSRIKASMREEQQLDGLVGIWNCVWKKQCVRRATHERSNAQGSNMWEEQCVKRATHEITTCKATTHDCSNTRRPTTTWKTCSDAKKTTIVQEELPQHKKNYNNARRVAIAQD